MAATHSTHAAHEAHVHHHEPGFWRKYIFSTDHKVIGIQYGVTALLFLMLGFLLMAAMRWQIAYPNKPMPVGGPILHALVGEEMMPSVKEADKVLGYTMSPDLYNSFGAMHGT